jgi:hypothetical protein
MNLERFDAFATALRELLESYGYNLLADVEIMDAEGETGTICE